MNLQRSTTVVTGGNRGLGRAFVESLVEALDIFIAGLTGKGDAA